MKSQLKNTYRRQRLQDRDANVITRHLEQNTQNNKSARQSK